jgi:hypothetical protein
MAQELGRMVLTEQPPTLSAQTKTAEMKVWQRERERERAGRTSEQQRKPCNGICTDGQPEGGADPVPLLPQELQPLMTLNSSITTGDSMTAIGHQGSKPRSETVTSMRSAGKTDREIDRGGVQPWTRHAGAMEESRSVLNPSMATGCGILAGGNYVFAHWLEMGAI